MKKETVKTVKRCYEAPTSWCFPVDVEHQLLAGSPPVRPGGSVTITPSTPDQSANPNDDILDED